MNIEHFQLLYICKMYSPTHPSKSKKIVFTVFIMTTIFYSSVWIKDFKGGGRVFSLSQHWKIAVFFQSCLKLKFQASMALGMHSFLCVNLQNWTLSLQFMFACWLFSCSVFQVLHGWREAEKWNQDGDQMKPAK